MPHLSLPGTAGSYLLAPYRAEYNEPSILDVRVEIDYDAYAGSQALINRWSGVSGTSVFQFYLTDNYGILQVRQNSSVTDQVVTDVPFTLIPGTATQLRARCDVPASQVLFYQRAVGTALPVDTGWTQTGSPRALPTVTSIAQPTQTGIQLGATSQGGTALMAAGKVFRAVVKKSAAGTPILDADPSDPTTWIFA